MNEVKEKIQKINKRFYEAIRTANLSMMEDLWAKTSDVKCIHPGWPIIRGWEQIRESWQTIFDTGGFASIEISNVYIDVNDDGSAWLNCTEKISYIIKNRMIITVAQTTNIFESKEEQWNIVLHHSSPMPIPRSEFSTETIQ